MTLLEKSMQIRIPHLTCFILTSAIFSNQILADVTVSGDVRPADPQTWTTITNVRAGEGAAGSIDVRNGTLVHIKDLVLGTSPGGRIGNASLNIRDSGTRFVNTQNLTVGSSAIGKLHVEDGALAQAQNMAVGSTAFGNGTVTVGGNGARIFFGDVGIGGFSFSGGTGVVNVESGGILETLGSIRIWGGGTLNVNGGKIMTRFGVQLEEPGATINFSGGNVSGNIGGSLSMSGGTLSTDVLSGNLNQTGGSLAPGNSPGTTQITGDYVLDEGTIEIELAGLDPGTGFDVVEVDGSATIDVADTILDVRFLNGFANTISATDSFTVLTAAGGLSGEFDGLVDGTRFMTSDGLGSFQISYTTNSIVLGNFVATIPEPVAAPFLAAMLIGCFLNRRRR